MSKTKIKQKKTPKKVAIREKERVIALVHESIIPYTFWFLLFFVWIVTPFFFLFPLFQEGTIGIIIFFTLVGTGSTLALRKWYSWQRTVMVITDQRIIDHDQDGFFERVISETTFDNISDVNYKVKGVFSTLFRYGTIKIRTKGNAADLEFRHAKTPVAIHNLINDLREAHAKA